MRWWKNLWSGNSAGSSRERLDAVRLTLPGWSEEASEGCDRVWRDPEGDLLALDLVHAVLPISDETALQRWCRDIAESRQGGLIEVRVVTGTAGKAAGFIYKRLQRPAYVFTGMLLVPKREGSQVWTVVAGERGLTGVREAMVTSELLRAGKLTLEEYESAWVDPYDPHFCGVDRSVLRFISDNPCYDERFPDHPLSKVRRILAILPDSVQVGDSRLSLSKFP